MNKNEILKLGSYASEVFLKTGASLNDIITGISEKEDLNPHQIQRVSEVANHRTFKSLLAGEDKNPLFELADPKKIVSKLNFDDPNKSGIMSIEKIDGMPGIKGIKITKITTNKVVSNPKNFLSEMFPTDEADEDEDFNSEDSLYPAKDCCQHIDMNDIFGDEKSEKTENSDCAEKKECDANSENPAFTKFQLTSFLNNVKDEMKDKYNDLLANISEIKSKLDSIIKKEENEGVSVNEIKTAALKTFPKMEYEINKIFYSLKNDNHNLKIARSLSGEPEEHLGFLNPSAPLCAELKKFAVYNYKLENYEKAMKKMGKLIYNANLIPKNNISVEDIEKNAVVKGVVAPIWKYFTTGPDRLNKALKWGLGGLLPAMSGFSRANQAAARGGSYYIGQSGTKPFASRPVSGLLRNSFAPATGYGA